MKQALVLVALVLANSASAADGPLPSIFGQQLGAPVSLPECQRMVLTYPHPDGSPAPYETGQAVTCQQMPESVLPETGAIRFTSTQLPAILKEKLVVTSIIDGRLNGVYAATQGYENADLIVEQLTAKFGKPTQVEAESVMIDTIARQGKVFEWKQSGYAVEYHTLSRHEGYGTLDIETDLGRDHRLQRKAKRDAERTPL